MPFHKLKKAFLWVTVTVILGAVGSGLWEMALKPSTQWLGKALLTTATFGSSALKDAIYVEAARGLHEASALQVLWLIILSVANVGAWVYGYYSARWGDSSFDGASPSTLEGKTGASLKEKLAGVKEELASLKRKARYLRFSLLGILLLIMGIELTSYLKDLQANEAYTFFAQAMKICRPYMDERQAQIFESRFASIQGRADYIRVIDDLRQVGAINKQRLPHFNPW